MTSIPWMKIRENSYKLKMFGKIGQTPVTLKAYLWGVPVEQGRINITIEDILGCTYFQAIFNCPSIRDTSRKALEFAKFVGFKP